MECYCSHHGLKLHPLCRLTQKPTMQACCQVSKHATPYPVLTPTLTPLTPTCSGQKTLLKTKVPVLVLVPVMDR